MDTKATVDVGEYSRYGRSRGIVPVKALDHDMRAKEKLIPGGILEPVSGKAFLFFTSSYKTSDFMVDGLLLWWNERKQDLSAVKRLVLNLDNGPECSGRRSQFLQRMVEFVGISGLEVRVIYYPPYHSKYNGIERYWAGLEKSWNGYLLDNVSTVLNRAGNFVWKRRIDSSSGGWHAVKEAYRQGIRITSDERLLGSNAFVERTLKAAGETYDRRMRLHSAGIDLSALIEAVCRHFGIEEKELSCPTKQVKIARARALIGYMATQDLSISGSEVARRLNIDRSAVSRAVQRARHDSELMATARIIWKLLKVQVNQH